MKEIPYRIVKAILYIYYFLFYRVTYIGRENIPKNGGVVLAGTHTSQTDILILGASTKRMVNFLGKIELFKGPGKWFMPLMGVIPVDRSKKNTEALAMAINELKNGKLIGIFPEGTINRTDDIIKRPFKYGAVKMAYESNSILVPFAIIGNVKPFKRVKIIFGDGYKVTDDIERENIKLENKVIELIRSGNDGRETH